eukprot:15437390-Alexandrium_andersonii.AAC.1
MGRTGEGLEYDEEPGEYYDQWGAPHPYTSEDYKADLQRYDQQQWTPKKNRGGGGGNKKGRG